MSVQVDASERQSPVPRGRQLSLELFGRAIGERDETAWCEIVADSRALVLAWINRHPARAAVTGDDDYWVNRTFERFWLALKPERLTAFSSVGALLAYLRACAHSILLDEARRRQPLDEGPLPEIEDEVDGTVDVETQVVSAVAAGELWAAVARELPDEADRLAIYLSFVRDQSPREIQRRHPAMFPSVVDVYRIKRNALDRLRRSERLSHLR